LVVELEVDRRERADYDLSNPRHRTPARYTNVIRETRIRGAVTPTFGGDAIINRPQD
jgi:hypothetical protein